MKYVVKPARVEGENISQFDEKLHVVIDKCGCVIAGPCSLKKANEIAEYLNGLEDEEENFALELFKQKKLLDEVKNEIEARRNQHIPK